MSSTPHLLRGNQRFWGKPVVRATTLAIAIGYTLTAGMLGCWEAIRRVSTIQEIDFPLLDRTEVLSPLAWWLIPAMLVAAGNAALWYLRGSRKAGGGVGGDIGQLVALIIVSPFLVVGLMMVGFGVGLVIPGLVT
jgi:hypothetical protein